MFSNFSLFKLSQIYQSLKLEQFKPNTVIYKERNDANLIYFLHEGEVEVFFINNFQNIAVLLLIYISILNKLS